MGDYFCLYRCRDCGRTATGPVNDSEPEGWGYDFDEAEWVCPAHAPPWMINSDD